MHYHVATSYAEEDTCALSRCYLICGGGYMCIITWLPAGRPGARPGAAAPSRASGSAPSASHPATSVKRDLVYRQKRPLVSLAYLQRLHITALLLIRRARPLHVLKHPHLLCLRNHAPLHICPIPQLPRRCQLRLQLLRLAHDFL